MPKMTPPDPRNLLPSRAHPEHRQRRKELEKEHPFGFTEVAVLSMIGVGIIWDIEKQVSKHEEKHQKEEAEQKKREEREKRRRERSTRGESRNPHSESGRSSERGGTSRRAPEGDRDRDPRRRQSIAYGHDERDSRRADRYYDARPRYEYEREREPRYERDSRYEVEPRYEVDSRYEVRYEPGRYEERRDLDPEPKRRSRRDSW